MKDIPIIYSGAMVCALIREANQPGTGKTMTRRLRWKAETVKSRMSFFSFSRAKAGLGKSATMPARRSGRWRLLSQSDAVVARQDW